jgi:hypothetical protein
MLPVCFIHMFWSMYDLLLSIFSSTSTCPFCLVLSYVFVCRYFIRYVSIFPLYLFHTNFVCILRLWTGLYLIILTGKKWIIVEYWDMYINIGTNELHPHLGHWIYVCMYAQSFFLFVFSVTHWEAALLEHCYLAVGRGRDSVAVAKQ